MTPDPTTPSTQYWPLTRATLNYTELGPTMTTKNSLMGCQWEENTKCNHSTTFMFILRRGRSTWFTEQTKLISDHLKVILELRTWTSSRNKISRCPPEGTVSWLCDRAPNRGIVGPAVHRTKTMITRNTQKLSNVKVWYSETPKRLSGRTSAERIKERRHGHFMSSFVALQISQ